MDTSLFAKYQAAQASAAHAVGTSLAPKTGASSNMRTAVGTASPFALKTAKATPADTSGTTGTSGTSSSASSAATDSATITSSDFLTLLVSELKNQDPTAPTDPNAYITQLVGVNSLEQLISINSGISSLDTAATTAAGGGTGSGSGSGGGTTGGSVPAVSSVPAITSTTATHQVKPLSAGSL